MKGKTTESKNVAPDCEFEKNCAEVKRERVNKCARTSGRGTSSGARGGTTTGRGGWRGRTPMSTGDSDRSRSETKLSHNIYEMSLMPQNNFDSIWWGHVVRHDAILRVMFT